MQCVLYYCKCVLAMVCSCYQTGLLQLSDCMLHRSEVRMQRYTTIVRHVTFAAAIKLKVKKVGENHYWERLEIEDSRYWLEGCL